MVRGTVVKLTSKRKQQLRTGIAGDRKSYRIGGPFFRQARTAGCVAQIAKFPQLLRGGLGALVAGCAALTVPSATKRQPRRVQPAAIFQFAGRKKERTRHGIYAVSLRAILLSEEPNRQWQFDDALHAVLLS